MNEQSIYDWIAPVRLSAVPSAKQADLFTPDHTRFDVTIQRNGETFETEYQCNTRYSQPDLQNVLSSLVSDALSVEQCSGVDDFADELGFEKPSQAIRAWEGCQAERDALARMGMTGFDDLAALDELLGETDKAEFAARVDALRRERGLDRPPLPEGWSYIEDLQADLDLGDWGDQLAEYTGYIGDAIMECADSNIDVYTADLKTWVIKDGNDKWIEEAKFQGLLEGVNEFDKMIRAAQYVCFSQDLYDHQEDSLRNAIYEHLKDDLDAVAISGELAERIADIDCSDTSDRMESLYEELDEAVAEACKESGPGLMTLEEAREQESGYSLGSEQRDAAAAKDALGSAGMQRAVQHTR